jgi:hypothetical protein
MLTVAVLWERADEKKTEVLNRRSKRLNEDIMFSRLFEIVGEKSESKLEGWMGWRGWGGMEGMESTDYEDCSRRSGDYRGLPYSTGYTLLKLQRVIPSSGKTCLR